MMMRRKDHKNSMHKSQHKVNVYVHLPQLLELNRLQSYVVQNVSCFYFFCLRTLCCFDWFFARHWLYEDSISKFIIT